MPSVSWNRNNLLRFPFWLWKSLCSSSGSSFVSGSSPSSGSKSRTGSRVQTLFSKVNKVVQNLALLMLEAALFPRKVVISFFIVDLFDFFIPPHVSSESKLGSRTGTGSKTLCSPVLLRQNDVFPGFLVPGLQHCLQYVLWETWKVPDLSIFVCMYVIT